MMYQSAPYCKRRQGPKAGAAAGWVLDYSPLTACCCLAASIPRQLAGGCLPSASQPWSSVHLGLALLARMNCRRVADDFRMGRALADFPCQSHLHIAVHIAHCSGATNVPGPPVFHHALALHALATHWYILHCFHGALAPWQDLRHSSINKMRLKAPKATSAPDSPTFDIVLRKAVQRNDGASHMHRPHAQGKVRACLHRQTEWRSAQTILRSGSGVRPLWSGWNLMPLMSTLEGHLALLMALPRDQRSHQGAPRAF
jgi:hypothetical protein